MGPLRLTFIQSQKLARIINPDRYCCSFFQHYRNARQNEPKLCEQSSGRRSPSNPIIENGWRLFSSGFCQLLKGKEIEVVFDVKPDLAARHLEGMKYPSFARTRNPGEDI